MVGNGWNWLRIISDIGLRLSRLFLVSGSYCLLLVVVDKQKQVQGQPLKAYMPRMDMFDLVTRGTDSFLSLSSSSSSCTMPVH
jgi:hypothetical protein